MSGDTWVGTILVEDAAGRSREEGVFLNRVDPMVALREEEIMFDTLIQDLRYAFRALRSSPGFTAVAVLSLGLGIGANTAIFSLINVILLKSLPVERPEELQQVLIGKNGSFTNPTTTINAISAWRYCTRK